MRIRRRVHVEGRVQGVFFRDSTRRVARDLGLVGWVRNCPDGRVEAVFEGDAAAVERALDFVRSGPPLARVVQVRVDDEPVADDSRDFEIR